MWFRNDLRVHDNEALWKACEGAESVVPLYCFDPRHFEKTQHFEFAKTGGKSPRLNLSHPVIFSSRQSCSLPPSFLLNSCPWPPLCLAQS